MDSPQLELAHYAAGGPVDCAHRWLKALLDDQDFPAFWVATHPTLRLCLAQEHLLRIVAGDVGDDTETIELIIAERRDDLDFIAGNLASPAGPGFHNWPAFVDDVLNTYASRWAPIEPDRWGAASRPRLVAPDLELVLLVDTGGEPFIVPAGAEPVDVGHLPHLWLLLAHHAKRGWQVAGYSTTAAPSGMPEPGWPPVQPPDTG